MSEAVEPAESADPAPSSTVAAVLGAVIGVPMLAYGIWGALDERTRVHPFELARWVIGADIAHDAIIAPVVVAVSWLIGRLVPEPGRAPFRWATGTTGVLCLIAWPFVRGYGRNASVPSLLDRNYAWGLAVYVALVWGAALVWAFLRRRAARAVHEMRTSTTTADADSTTA